MKHRPRLKPKLLFELLGLLLELTHLPSEIIDPAVEVLDPLQVALGRVYEDCRDVLGVRLPSPMIHTFFSESIALGLYPFKIDVQRVLLVLLGLRVVGVLLHYGGKVLLRGRSTAFRGELGLRGITCLAFRVVARLLREVDLDAEPVVLRVEPLVLRHVDGCSCCVCGRRERGGSTKV